MRRVVGKGAWSNVLTGLRRISVTRVAPKISSEDRRYMVPATKRYAESSSARQS